MESMRWNWKQWPYWLRGGVIGGGIIVLSSILSLSCLYFLTPPTSWGFECLPFAIPSLPIIEVLLLSPTTYSFSSATVLSIEVAIYFILGSLIGAFVGYIKKKKGQK